ncbi:hypothetical protein [Clostridium sp. BSD9I1]|uniref:hypothetical protein n=1 Tax=Clostridium sp. BSD9I1 TaxID=2003589 RepID=UPI0016460370|nr:hypothetical protein [Clostridium sp. BSD9I1]
MKNELKKISKIVQELMDFCLLNGALNLNISLSNTENFFEIIAHSYNVTSSNQEISNLKQILNLKRQREIEEYYWQLAGSDEGTDQLSLIGMMIDEAEVEFSPPNLTIKLIRYK